MFVHSLNKVSGENKVAGAFSAKVGTFIVKLILGDKHGDVEAAHFGVYLAAQRLLVDRHGVAWRVPVDLRGGSRAGERRLCTSVAFGGGYPHTGVKRPHLAHKTD